MPKASASSEGARLRLADSSIWIAFHRLGHLGVLLRLPNLRLSSGVLRELSRQRDGLAEKAEQFLLAAVSRVELAPEDLFHTQLIHSDFLWISEADIDQVAYAIREYPDVILYMRDRDAERVAASRGIRVRTHHELVDDLLALKLCSQSEYGRLRHDLDGYFPASGGTRR